MLNADFSHNFTEPPGRPGAETARRIALSNLPARAAATAAMGVGFDADKIPVDASTGANASSTDPGDLVALRHGTAGARHASGGRAASVLCSRPGIRIPGSTSTTAMRRTARFTLGG